MNAAPASGRRSLVEAEALAIGEGMGPSGALARDIASLPLIKRGGRVRSCSGTLVVAGGLNDRLGLGETCWIERHGATQNDKERAFSLEEAVMAEVVGLDASGVRLLPYGELTGVGLGARVSLDPGANRLWPASAWRGRVIDALVRPVDGGGALERGARAYKISAPALPAHRRQLMGARLELGVRALDLFTPCCSGQRLGIFAGSGVGKSTMMSMIARRSNADVIVVGLIGERGRELNEFLHDTLGPEGLARSVVVVATSDQPAMMRRRAAYVTMAVAEFFRDQGLKVLCLLDSVTRFAMALREIFLAAGEPPTTKGYPPSVFAEMPRLLERAGPGENEGSITGLFTVLVEGDDTNEPIADAVRGILDGHVILDRRIAEAGRYPAVDVLKSLSRSAPRCYAPEERPIVAEARKLLGAYAEMAELIQLGAYKSGSNLVLDQAIALRPAIEQLLSQSLEDRVDSRSPFDLLRELLVPRAPAPLQRPAATTAKQRRSV